MRTAAHTTMTSIAVNAMVACASLSAMAAFLVSSVSGPATSIPIVRGGNGERAGEHRRIPLSVGILDVLAEGPLITRALGVEPEPERVDVLVEGPLVTAANRH